MQKNSYVSRFIQKSYNLFQIIGTSKKVKLEIFQFKLCGWDLLSRCAWLSLVYICKVFKTINGIERNIFHKKWFFPIWKNYHFFKQARLRRAYFTKSARPNLKFWIGKICYIWFEHGQVSEIWLSKIPLDQNFHCDVCLN